MFKENEVEEIMKDLRDSEGKKIKSLTKNYESKNYYVFRTGYYDPKYDYRLKEVLPGIQLYF